MSREGGLREELASVASIYDESPISLVYAIDSVLSRLKNYYPEVDSIFSDYREAVRRYKLYETASIDEALGLSKRTHIDSKRFWVNHALRIYVDVQSRVANGATKPAVFEEIAERSSRGAKSIERIYYKVKKLIDEEFEDND